MTLASDNRAARTSMRHIDRIHRCEGCMDIFYCDACSAAATAAASHPKGAEHNSDLYSEQCSPIGNRRRVPCFICQRCRKSHRKIARPA